MRKCHIAGLAVVWACALVSVPAVAGPPPFPDQLSPSLHYQFQENTQRMNLGACEQTSDGELCLTLYAEVLPWEDSVSVNAYEALYGSTFTNFRGVWCRLPLDTLDIAVGARAANFEALVDIARDGCWNYGYRFDFSTGEWSDDGYPNDVSIRAYVNDPGQKESWTSIGQRSNADGARENVSCKGEGGENFQNGSIEINGSSVLVTFSQVSRNRCNTTGKE